MLLICHFGGKAKRPRSAAAAADSSDSETDLAEYVANGINANVIRGAVTSEQR